MDEGTFLENYLMSLETLPNDVRRDFELVTAPPHQFFTALLSIPFITKTPLVELTWRNFESDERAGP
jgi:hypothetical protein